MFKTNLFHFFNYFSLLKLTVKERGKQNKQFKNPTVSAKTFFANFLWLQLYFHIDRMNQKSGE